jgi:hypothetical protein
MRTRFKGFSIIPVASLALALMLPARAVSHTLRGRDKAREITMRMFLSLRQSS